ncbi:MAG: CheR family methyltransferase [Gammaproteobacteria bacterium]|nr:CheR family methyltransferase [Gammaproteobacteria bacterium]
MDMDVTGYSITQQEFAKFRELIYALAGIKLSDEKKTLVVSRLSKRLRHYSFSTFSQYLDLLASNRHPHEQQILVDLLTTNETYFFREASHFSHLVAHYLEHAEPHRNFSVWSAASSSGEEAYSLAMLLRHAEPNKKLEILGTDISSRMIKTAQRGLYPLSRTSNIPADIRNKYCLKGVRSHEGSLLVSKEIQALVHFRLLNLLGEWQQIGQFDAIFLRNVMIYFDLETKRKLVQKIVQHLRPGALFYVGMAEGLNGITHELKTIAPSVYRKAL